MTAAEQCKDKAGQPTGMLDMAVLQTYAQQQCSPVSFAALPSGASCPYSGEGVRTFKISTATIDWYLKKFGKTALHGVYLIPKDLPSTIAATMPQFAADKQEGIKEDAEFGASAGDTQSNYTPYVQAHQVAQLHVRARRSRLRRAPCSSARRRRCRASTP